MESNVTQKILNPFEVFANAAIEKVLNNSFDVVGFINLEWDENAPQEEKLRVLAEKRTIIEKNIVTLLTFDTFNESDSNPFRKLISMNEGLLERIESMINRNIGENAAIHSEEKSLTAKQQILLADHLGIFESKKLKDLSAARIGIVLSKLFNKSVQLLRTNFSKNDNAVMSVKKNIYTIENIRAVNEVLKEVNLEKIPENRAN